MFKLDPLKIYETPDIIALRKLPICQYAAIEVLPGTQTDKAPAFQNAKKLILRASVDTAPDIPIHETDLEIISGCTLGSLTKKPVSFPESSTSVDIYNEINDKDALRIYMHLVKIDGNGKRNFKDPIFQLKVTFHRAGTQDFSSSEQICAQPFPDSKDQEIFLQDLSSAVKICLMKVLWL